MTVWRKLSLVLRTVAYVAGLAGLSLALRGRLIEGRPNDTMRMAPMLMVLMFVLFLASYLLIAIDVVLRPARGATPRRARSFIDRGESPGPEPPETTGPAGGEPDPAPGKEPETGKPRNGH